MNCRQHNKGYCDKVNMTVPETFCRYICKGEWERYKKGDIDELRIKNRMPLTDAEKNDKDLVSVIIPVRGDDTKYIQRTVDNLFETAIGPLEVFVMYDGVDFDFGAGGKRVLAFYEAVPVGQRKLMNMAATMANGKYIFRADAHCSMSPEWDARMKSSCGGTDIVNTVFDILDVNTWKGTKRDVMFTSFDKNMNPATGRYWKRPEERELEEEVMGMCGNAWMIRRDYYWRLAGCDEYLGFYGGIGAEWTLKVWLTGGRVIVRTDVVCNHLFRKIAPFDIDSNARERMAEKIKSQWLLGTDKRIVRSFDWLKEHFREHVTQNAAVRI